MALGVIFVATSRFQAYPLRVQIREQAEGTAAYIVQKVAKLMPPDSVVTISPMPDKKWARFVESPNGKVVFIPRWEVETEEGTARVHVTGDQIIRVIPTESEDRVVEKSEGVKGRFACISGERPWEQGRHPRWLTMRQPEREEAVHGVVRALDVENWHEVQRLLQQRAQLPIAFPEWQQMVMEEMCERDDRALRHVPALLQAWRTMCLIQSFQSEKNDKAVLLRAAFEDLAAATLLAKKIFREACWFPSCKKVFAKLPKWQDRTSAIHPLTGKPVVYARHEKEDPVQYHSLLEE